MLGPHLVPPSHVFKPRFAAVRAKAPFSVWDCVRVAKEASRRPQERGGLHGSWLRFPMTPSYAAGRARLSHIACRSPKTGNAAMSA